MVALWHIYHVNECRYRDPPKGKFVAIVCANPNPYGFLINTGISNYVKNRPQFLAGQVSIKAIRYSFLRHNSYVDCSRILSFRKGELHKIQSIQNNTRTAIKKIVSNSRLIAPVYEKLICGE